VTNLVQSQASRDSNSSAVAVSRIPRRPLPNKTMAIRTWGPMKCLLQFTLLAIFLAALPLSVAAQARTYEVLSTNVPFKFNVGHRSFRPGHYQFILLGPGLLAMRDSHARIIASVISRSRETGGPAPATKLVFDTPKNHRAQLAEIWIENRSQVLEITGEEFAVRQPGPPPALPAGIESMYINDLFGRSTAPGMKH
jgi:hypothetical protein